MHLTALYRQCERIIPLTTKSGRWYLQPISAHCLRIDAKLIQSLPRFRPRILHDVENIDLSTTMLGTKVDIPFYVTATALGKLGHPEGEVSIPKALSLSFLNPRQSHSDYVCLFQTLWVSQHSFIAHLNLMLTMIF